MIPMTTQIKNINSCFLTCQQIHQQSQSFYKTPKDIRLNCSHYCLYEFPSSKEANRISSELGVKKEDYKTATKKLYSFLYVDKPKKRIAKNFVGGLHPPADMQNKNVIIL